MYCIYECTLEYEESQFHFSYLYCNKKNKAMFKGPFTKRSCPRNRMGSKKERMEEKREKQRIEIDR